MNVNNWRDPATIRIKGLFDSAWWLEDFTPYPGITVTNLVEQTRAIYTLANAQPQENCTNIYGENLKWQCGFPTNLWPYFRTEHSYNFFLTDQWQLGQISNGAINPPLTSDQNDYVSQFLLTTRFSLAPAKNSHRNIFASTCFTHCSTESDNYFNIKINNTNLDTAISEWFFHDVPFQLIDSCSTFQCGQGCP